MKPDNTFIPNAEDTLEQPPESIHAISQAQARPYAGITLTALPITGLKSFTVALLILLLVIAGSEVVALYQQAAAWHWALAYGFVALVVVTGVLLLLALVSFITGRRDLKKLGKLQAQAERVSQSLDLGNASVFYAALEQFYQGKPQADLLSQCRHKLPDYSNDQEAISHLNQHFLQPLDLEAQARVAKYSLQTAVAVSLSPWVSLDLALALWRNLRMIDDVAQVYGIRPSLATRLKLLRLVINQLLLVGVSEAVIDTYAEQMGIDALGGLAAARGLQGIGAGIYAIRIGVAAMQVCRPIAFAKGEEPKFGQIVAELLQGLKRRLF